MRAIQLPLVGVIENAATHGRQHASISNVRNRNHQLPHGSHEFAQVLQHVFGPPQVLQYIAGQNYVKAPSSQCVPPVRALQVA